MATQSLGNTRPKDLKDVLEEAQSLFQALCFPHFQALIGQGET